MKGPFYYPPIGFGGSGLRCVAILDLEAVHAQGLATQTNIFPTHPHTLGNFSVTSGGALLCKLLKKGFCFQL